MCSREEKIAIEIKEEFCRRVIPSHIIRYLKCITTQDAEKVKAVEKQDGPIYAAEILLERLVRRPDWLNDLKRVLLIPDVGLLDFGEKLEEQCRQLIVTVCATEDCIYGHGCGEKIEETLVKSPPTDEVKMCTQEEEIANEIKDEFCCRVIPSGIIRYLSCLTIQDMENVTTAEKHDGPIYAAEILLERLVRRPDWLNDLKRVLLIPDVGLLDFGEKLEEQCRQSNVMKSPSTDKASRRISSEEQNYVRMSKIVLEVLSGVLYDRLYIDTKTGEILDRDKLDITEMCKKYCALKINFPSKGFRKIGKVDEISTIEDTIGDDIQRIRVIRNEMQHSSNFALDDIRYQTLITIVHDMLTRFDQHNNPAGESYVKRLDEIRKMELETRSFEEITERMKAELMEKIHAVVDSVVSYDLNDINFFC